MRILVLPLALAFAACLYLPCPQAAGWIADAIRRLYLRFLSPFTRKSGRRDETLALVLFLLLAGGLCQLIGGIHVVLAALVTTGVGLMPESGFVRFYGGSFVPAMKWLAKFFIAMAMAAIGLNTNIVSLIKNGGKPILLGFCCWLSISAVSILVQFATHLFYTSV